MRNVIRNILTKWSNVFGRQAMDLIYTFEHEGSFSGQAYITDDVPVELLFVLIHNGVVEKHPMSFNNPNSNPYISIGIPPTQNNTINIYRITGERFALAINGIIVYDNR